MLYGSIEWLRPILILGIETGLRQGELLNLRWSNVDLFRRTLTILEQKNKGEDTLPVNEKAMEVFEQLAENPNCEMRWIQNLAMIYIVKQRWDRLKVLAEKVEKRTKQP